MTSASLDFYVFGLGCTSVSNLKRPTGIRWGHRIFYASSILSRAYRGNFRHTRSAMDCQNRYRAFWHPVPWATLHSGYSWLSLTMVCTTTKQYGGGNFWLRIGMLTYWAQRNGKPAVVRKLYPSWLVRQDRGDERGSTLFFKGLLENFDSKHGLGIHFLELRIFPFQSL